MQIIITSKALLNEVFSMHFIRYLLEYNCSASSVKVPVVKEATAFGVAMAGGIGAGVYHDYVEAGKNLVKIEKIYEPNKHNFDTYEQIKEKWVKIYAKQLELVDSSLTESMWKAPGI